MDKKEYAVKLKHERHNCAQAILCAYADELDLSLAELKALGAAFGTGMGCLKSDCGALIAAEMLLGLFKYQGKPIFKEAAEVYRSFVEKCGAARCEELKGIASGTVLCECDDCIRHAVMILEEAKGETADEDR